MYSLVSLGHCLVSHVWITDNIAFQVCGGIGVFVKNRIHACFESLLRRMVYGTYAHHLNSTPGKSVKAKADMLCLSDWYLVHVLIHLKVL